MNEIALLIVVVCVIALPLGEMLKKKVKANKENAKIESDIERGRGTRKKANW